MRLNTASIYVSLAIRVELLMLEIALNHLELFDIFHSSFLRQLYKLRIMFLVFG